MVMYRPNEGAERSKVAEQGQKEKEWATKEEKRNKNEK